MVVVNGPIRERLGLNAKRISSGPAPAPTPPSTIAAPGPPQLSRLPPRHPRQVHAGWAGKYSLCFAEDEASSPWEPLHVSRGFAVGQSTVTVFAAESGHNVLSHGTADPEQLLTCFADAMAGLGA